MPFSSTIPNLWITSGGGGAGGGGDGGSGGGARVSLRSAERLNCLLRLGETETVEGDRVVVGVVVKERSCWVPLDQFFPK